MGHIIVIGAGQAGSSCCAKLRNLGYEGEITLIGAEFSPPYQRPPLSKGYLLGEIEKERLFLRPESFYKDQNITLHLGQAVTRISPEDKTVTLGDETLEYDELVLTTGSDPRHLPASIGGTLDGVYPMRGLKCIDDMSEEFKPGRHVLIVGGGYIGLETAAVSAKLGLKVTLVELADRILQRVASSETSDYFRDLHTANGVNILEKTGLERLLGEDRVTSAQLSDGSQIDVDFVVVGVGIKPAGDLAVSAGLDVDNGIVTDLHCRTSKAHIWAAGDCASFPLNGEQIRLESVQNAIEQAENVAKNIMGDDVEYAPHPWFWSDQYAVKLQIAGLNTGFDEVITRQGEADGAVSHWYYKDGTLISVDAMNAPRAYMVGKRLIEAGKSPSPADISDPETDLKGLLKA